MDLRKPLLTVKARLLVNEQNTNNPVVCLLRLLQCYQLLQRYGLFETANMQAAGISNCVEMTSVKKGLALEPCLEGKGLMNLINTVSC